MPGSDPMDIFPTIDAMQLWSLSRRREGRQIAFVPTMGALHAGHRALIEIASREADCVVVSIFVNPTQFGPQEDLQKYPRTFAHDETLCREAGVEALFYPTPDLMYAPDHSCCVVEELLTRGLCGPFRPGHFKGVLTVVAKLFNIVLPDVAVFGQKDYQQARLIERMVRDLNFPLRIKIAPTIREADGLALSSRNRYLSIEERHLALCVPETLDVGRRLYAAGRRSSAELQAGMHQRLNQTPQARLEYLEIVDGRTLQPVDTADEATVAAIALRLGNTRLIDNQILSGRAADFLPPT
jgi:pantoate--beta-alanine ligase